ncbi:MAG: hypothetical protein AB1609_05725 [Bacillota bacterium]
MEAEERVRFPLVRRALCYVGRSAAATAVGALVMGAVALSATLAAGLHRLPPGRSAVIREVFARSGSLLSPLSPPYRVRVVSNEGRRTLWFWTQPTPFGRVEEVLERAEPITVEFSTFRWRKDALTGTAADARWNRELQVAVRLELRDIERYARQDDLLSGTAPAGPPASRRDVLTERLRGSFERFLDAQIERLTGDLPARFQFIASELSFAPGEDVAARLVRWEAYARRHPWLLLVPEAFARIQGERPDMIQRLALLLQLFAAGQKEEDLGPEAGQFVEELRDYFRGYAESHPEQVDEETWRWVIQNGRPGLSGQALAARFLEAHVETVERQFQASLVSQGFEAAYGLAPVEVRIFIGDRLVEAGPPLAHEGQARGSQASSAESR